MFYEVIFENVLLPILSLSFLAIALCCLFRTLKLKVDDDDDKDE